MTEHTTSQGYTPTSTGVCVLTAHGMAAIAAVALTGAGAKGIVERIFAQSPPPCGKSVYGTVKNGDTAIDDVILACEYPDFYVIHCHGNPLLVEQIVRLAQRHGATVQDEKQLLFDRFRASADTLIEAEANLAMTQAATLEAVTLLNRQKTAGLSEWVSGWINFKNIDIKELRSECAAVTKRSAIAARLIDGVRIALIGPPNSGKSTLLNRLADDKTALVSDTAGTTRDWVSTTCRIGPLRVELIDTAGLDADLAGKDALQQAAQAATERVAGRCELTLHVCDCTLSATAGGLPKTGGQVLNVFTKSDLLENPDDFCPADAAPFVLVSAQQNRGLEALCQQILTLLGVADVPDAAPIVFTPRQHSLLRAIAECEDKNEIYALFRQLRDECVNEL